MLLTEGLRDFFSDFTNPKLFILKCNYFFLLSAVVILWPQFTIHQKALGLTEYQTGTISSVLSVTTIFFPIIGGFIGDKIGNYKIPMVVLSVMTAVLTVLFTWVPSSMSDNPASNITNARFPNASYNGSVSTPDFSNQEYHGKNLQMTFWIYICVRISYGIIQGLTYTLYEAAVMANSQASGVNYGYQRAWGTIGALISSYLGGVIVDKTGGFNELFYVSAALQVISGLLMLGVNLDFKMPAISLTKEVFKHVIRAEAILAFGAVLAAGMFSGYLETFMYLYLLKLGATKVLLGLTVTVGAPFEFFVTILTSYVVRLFGFGPIITLGLLVNAVEFLGLSLLQNPWWVLLLEVFGSAAGGFLFTATIIYITDLFPTETIASFRGLHGVLFYGIGKLLGITIGREIKERMGHRQTFGIWAGLAVLSAFVYCFSYFALRKYRSKGFINNEESGKGDLTGIENKGWVE